MAEITTHILFAKDIQKKIKCDNSIILYSIGPDAFFFNKKTQKLGNIMHRKNTYLFFENYINYIKNNNLENDKYIVGSLYGFLSHYVLDYKVHPYIFYKDHLDKNLHRIYEMSLSKYMIEKHKYKSNEYKMYNDIKINYNNKIIKLLNAVIFETYGYENMGIEYINCLKKTRRTYRLFRFDKYGIKKVIYRIIDIFTKNRLKNVSFYNIKDEDLNLSNNIWNHPCDIKEKSNKSLVNLYDEGLNETLKIINNLDKTTDLKNVIRNYSYTTGKDCNLENRMKYFDV